MSLYARNRPYALGGSGGGGGVTIVGAFDSQTPSANGATIIGSDIYFQSASATVPGMVNTTAQTFAGAKTFTSPVTIDANGSGFALNIIGESGAPHPNWSIQAPTNSQLVFDNASSLAIPLVLSYTGQVGIGTTPNGNAELDVRATSNQYVMQLFNPTSLPQDFLRLYDGSNNLMLNVDSTGKLFAANLNDAGLTANTAIATDASKNLVSSSTTDVELGYVHGVTSAIQTQLNGKQATLSITNLTDVGTDGITIGNGTGAVIGASPVTIAQHVADTTHNGYLASTDWNTFNGKQAAGSYLTALTGDGTATGPGSAAFTLASVNSNIGSFTYASITVNAKGLITAAANGTAPLSNPMTTLGDTIYENATPAPARLAGNTTAVKQYLSQTGTGSASAAPVWATLSAADIGSGTLPLNRGGTGADLSSGTNDGVLYFNSGGSDLAVTAAGSSGQVLTSGGGGGSAPAFQTVAGNVSILKAPTVQTFLSTGSTTGYAFVVSSANATVGATYTNNGHTYTVLNTISSATTLFATQASAPTASGTLTKSGGTGDATITFSAAQAFATYTAPTSPAPLYIRVRAVGGGGPGSGSGTTTPTGTTSFASYFGANLIVAGGGGAGSGAVGPGGTASLGTGPVGVALVGGGGQGAGINETLTTQGVAGGQGGASAFGGTGSGAIFGAAGGNGVANTGGGGGGAGSGSTAAVNNFGGQGGGAGGFVDAIIASVSATYPYAVGPGGTGGSAGTDGFAGGNGGSGLVEVIEYYQ